MGFIWQIQSKKEILLPELYSELRGSLHGNVHPAQPLSKARLYPAGCFLAFASLAIKAPSK